MSKLNLVDAWTNDNSKFFASKNAQGYFSKGLPTTAGSSTCGSSCGAGNGDKDKEKPSSCGSSCGAGGNK